MLNRAGLLKGGNYKIKDITEIIEGTSNIIARKIVFSTVISPFDDSSHIYQNNATVKMSVIQKGGTRSWTDSNWNPEDVIKEENFTIYSPKVILVPPTGEELAGENPMIVKQVNDYAYEIVGILGRIIVIGMVGIAVMYSMKRKRSKFKL